MRKYPLEISDGAKLAVGRAFQFFLLFSTRAVQNAIKSEEGKKGLEEVYQGILQIEDDLVIEFVDGAWESMHRLRDKLLEKPEPPPTDPRSSH